MKRVLISLLMVALLIMPSLVTVSAVGVGNKEVGVKVDVNETMGPMGPMGHGEAMGHVKLGEEKGKKGEQLGNLNRVMNRTMNQMMDQDHTQYMNRTMDQEHTRYMYRTMNRTMEHAMNGTNAMENVMENAMNKTNMNKNQVKAQFKTAGKMHKVRLQDIQKKREQYENEYRYYSENYEKLKKKGVSVKEILKHPNAFKFAKRKVVAGCGVGLTYLEALKVRLNDTDIENKEMLIEIIDNAIQIIEERRELFNSTDNPDEFVQEVREWNKEWLVIKEQIKAITVELAIYKAETVIDKGLDNYDRIYATLTNLSADNETFSLLESYKTRLEDAKSKLEDVKDELNSAFNSTDPAEIREYTLSARASLGEILKDIKIAFSDLRQIFVHIKLTVEG
ncbi:hypothetical protein Asulf_00281 [Archaeoglobus sulfaticallidus PM70-1]|uniref:Uncharacterized protein n=1 Tax=Archaeoglobus sulfaticallidus PM70-1 TaxID=387631 RepID=N0B9N8_9EURY|nr:hypothetical protein [Archaeoglobus sulfaticallidus]AGK60314.1 hypothetical protein Asulf_00281 [Archaeoglobus sulfaticallidus PM70-1]